MAVTPDVTSGPTSDFIVIADLHLQHDSEATLKLANHFLTTKAPTTKHLYIAGDLVEYWVGDDAHTDELNSTFDCLRALSANGTAVTVMHGNRDFLLGDSFASRIHAHLERQDSIIITSGSQQYLLLHGDTLCTDDHEYQSLRAQLRDPAWQTHFLTQSIEQRHAFARSVREKSKADSSAKSTEIMDVNQQAVLALMQTTGINQLIHGHTHRPAMHRVDFTPTPNQPTVEQHDSPTTGITTSADTTDPPGTRWVVGDWHPDEAQYVEATDGVVELKTWSW